MAFSRCKHCNKKTNNTWITDKKGKQWLACGHADCPSHLPPAPPPAVAWIKFAQPQGTSRFEDFSYRAGYFMEKAQDERRAAEAASHMGGTKQIYNELDDISSGNHFGEVQ